METISNRVKENHTIATDILDDLASRFIINIPDSDRSNFVRICFQIELAHWFYLDFYCTGEDNRALVPCGIKQFASHIFNHIPFLSLHVKNLDNILQEWKQYKMSVPTYGAILMTSDLKHVLLVQSYWAKSSWGFPKGKVNENEDPLHCAIREVYEETGYDIANLADKDDFIEGVLNYQYTRLYLIRNVPIETVFVPRTRKEIKCCEWFSIEHLPTHKTDPVSRNHLGINANSFFMIMPFVKRLKRWINEQAHPNQIGKRANTKAGMAIDRNVSMTPTECDPNVNSPNIVFFKDNAGHRRQRHKSMGDFDSTNVIAHDTTSDIDYSNDVFIGVDSNVTMKPVPGKRKLLSANNVDQTFMKRSSSPIIGDFQLHTLDEQMTADGSTKNSHLKSLNKNLNNQCQNNIYGNGKSKYVLAKLDNNNKKKKNSKPNWAATYDLGDESENECPTVSLQWQHLFNPPKLSQLLSNEPSINQWRNVRLNKDIIMNECMKLSEKK